MKLEFDAKLVPAGVNGTSCFLEVPFDVQKTFATRGRVPVSGTINGYPFRSSIMPREGRHVMCVNRQMRDGSGAAAGETAHFVMQRDEKPRTVTVPPALLRALAANAKAKAVFNKLAYTHQKEYAEWIASAKKPEALERRLRKMTEMLGAKAKQA